MLDLFDRRRATYGVVREAVSRMTGSLVDFDQKREVELREVVVKIYFSFGDYTLKYLNQLVSNITDVRDADKETKDLTDSVALNAATEKRRGSGTASSNSTP